MKRTWILAGLTLLGLSAALPAQERTFVFGGGRPRIGISVDTRADADADKIGARVREIIPDGPADKAGLKAGDIITRFNGKSLAGVKADDDDESGPGQKLIELARSLDSGDTVEVEYRRGNETRKATLVAQELEHHSEGHFRMEMPEMRGMMELPRMMDGHDGMPGEMKFFMGGRLGGLDLADLNPGLGDYFGTREGVLVLQTPEDSTLPLKAGDVILSIDGRKPQSVSHALGILHSYDKGEVVKLDIMRKQKRTTVSWTVPESKDMKWKTREPFKVRTPGSERS
jgi:S1-C subfamily serine protease